jgi:hypothetical protein
MVGAVPARAGARLARLQWWLRWWARTLRKAERYPKKLNASTDLAISQIWAKWKMSGNSCFFNSHKLIPANMNFNMYRQNDQTNFTFTLTSIHTFGRRSRSSLRAQS